jgi:hypothetical protein
LTYKLRGDSISFRIQNRKGEEGEEGRKKQKGLGIKNLFAFFAFAVSYLDAA